MNSGQASSALGDHGVVLNGNVNEVFLWVLDADFFKQQLHVQRMDAWLSGTGEQWMCGFIYLLF